MYKNSKLKIIRNRNYYIDSQNHISNYPSIYNKSFRINPLSSKINSQSFNNKTTVKSQKKFIRTSSAFLERNYNNYLSKVSKKKLFLGKSMIQEHQLNSLLYKLKKYNNELMTYNEQKKNTIKILKNNLLTGETRLKKLQELQDIELPYEKISIKNFNEIKLSKENMEQKLFDLIEDKQKIDYSLKNEEEYNKTIEYMLEEEQNRLFSIKKESHIIEEKLINLKKYQKIVSDNMNLDTKKEENFMKLKSQILKDIQLVEQVKDNQNMSNEILQNQINEKENEIKELESQVKKLKDYQDNGIQISKNKLKEEIENAKEVEKKRLNDEMKCIEIIYCLYIIQKYFYEDNNYDKKKLVESKDYQLLYRLKNEDNIGNITIFNNKKYKKDSRFNSAVEKNYMNEGDITNKDSMIQKNRLLSSTHINKISTNINSIEESKLNNTTKNFHPKITLKTKYKSSRNSKNNSFKNTKFKTVTSFFHSNSELASFSNDINNLNELLTKFKSIKLTHNQISDFISKLLSKLDFYRSQLNFYHNKELNLEDDKTKYENIVKNIISNNYFNFEEFTKNNSKIKNFLEKNEFFIKEMKKNYKKIQKQKIIEKINQNDEIDKTEDNDNLNNTDYINENDITEDNIVFKASKGLILQIKNFFLRCTDLLKEIIILQKDKNRKINNNTIEEDNEVFIKENNLDDEEYNTNQYVIIFKKLIEFKKNKDIEISNDYKLLLQYVKNLIKFCQENNNIISKDDLEDIKLNLFHKFYKNGDIQQKPDKIFIKRFFIKKPANFNDVFIHFISLSEQVIDNVKSINDLITNSEINNINDINNRYKLSNDILLEDNNNKMNLLLSPKKVSNPSVYNNESQSSESKSIKYKKYSKKKYKKLKSAKSVNIISTNNEFNNKFQELCFDEEDNESVDTQSTKKIILKKKKKINSIDDKIINKLYTPFLEKNQYLRQLNPNIPGIKQMTSSSSKVNHELKKIIGEVNITTHQMQIYNNPILDINRLCNNTYNSLVKLIYDNTRRNKKRIKK